MKKSCLEVELKLETEEVKNGEKSDKYEKKGRKQKDLAGEMYISKL